MDVGGSKLSKPLAQMYAYWQQKCGDRLMPSRADIDPVGMRAFLPNTMLVDVLTTPMGEKKFRVRLVGTHIVNGYGSEFTGKYIEEINLGDQLDIIINSCMEIVNAKAPHFLAGKLHLEDTNELISFERLGVPLSSDGDNVNIILMAASVLRSQAST